LAGDEIDLLLQWPLVLTIEDCYVPEVAAPLLQGLRNLDEEAGRVTVKLWAMEAERDLRQQVN
jgi:hypothetical protein